MKMVIKEVDGQGRIVIPKEWRKEEGIGPNTKVEMIKEGRNISIKPLKYKSLMDLKGIIEGDMTLEEIENAEADAAVKRFEKNRR